MTASSLIRKLSSVATLSEQDIASIGRLPLRFANLRSGETVVRDGEMPTHCCLLISGFMSRFKVLPNGSRQILAFHTSGDIPDLQSLHLRPMDHTLAAVSPSSVAFMRHEAVHALLKEAPNLAAVLWRETLIDAAIFRAWIVSMGRLPAPQHMAHLFCEIFTRKYAIGEAQRFTCDLPITQSDLGDALGISAVHVNRTLQELRTERLFEFEHGRLTIHDWKRAKEFSSFDPCYLQIHEDKLPR